VPKEEKSRAESFFSSLSVVKFRLERPKRFLFLCGGILAAKAEGPGSARDLFLRSLPDPNVYKEHEIILAERIDGVFDPTSPYKNLIELEIDIAQISDLIVLFSEGYGSLAELGAFSQIPPIAERLMVILKRSHYDEKKSFIKNGPIRFLEEKDQETVFAFDWETKPHNSNSYVNEASFSSILPDIKTSIDDRISKVPRTHKFDAKNFGHKILLACAIVEFYRAAILSDIEDALKWLGIRDTQASTKRMMFCACAVNWVRKEKRGHRDFYVPLFSDPICKFAYKKGGAERNTLRWKMDIRREWKVSDQIRDRLIVALVEDET